MTNATKPIELLILQPTPFCNIDCSYCYLPNRTDKRRMTDEVIAAACDRAVEAGRVGETLTIVWHAGEPLVLPIGYYEHALGVAASRLPNDTRIEHHFQTNATLIDDAWCEFFRRPGIKVGVSIDGPRALHDRNRRTRSGAGTFDRAMAGVRRLVAHDIEFHVISVLTRDALFFPDEIHDFHADNGFRHVCFNVEEIEGTNARSSLSDPRCEALFVRFFERYRECMAQSGVVKSVRELGQAFGLLLRPRPASELRNQQAEPFLIVTVGLDGSYSTFSPEMLGMTDERWGDFVIGNVLTDSFEKAAATVKFAALNGEIAAGLDRCKATCGYYDVCGGGAPGNKLYETGRFDSTETLFCRYTIKLLTEMALGTLERAAASAPSL